MSIVRVGLAETKNYSEGYDAIFGKKKAEKDDGKTSAKADKAKPDAESKTPKKKTKK